MTKKIEISSILKNSKSLVDIFNLHADKKPQHKIFFFKKKNIWISNNFLEIKKKIEKIKVYFINNGIKKGDRVFLLSNNRVEWVEFDLAIMSSGAITVPSFVTNNQSDNEFILNDCKPKFLVLENESIYKKNKSFLKINKNKIVTIESSNMFENYENIVNKATTTQVKKIVIKKKQISSIIYTSGTTGNPKGVVLTHESIMHNLFGALEIMDEFELNNERFISFLPLSHSYERMAGLYFPILIKAQIYFCSSMDKLLNEIKETKPTILSAVPRLYENIFKKIKLQITQSNFIVSFFLKIIFDSLDLKKHNFFKNVLSTIFIKLVLEKKIKKLLGGNIKILISGGAALNPEIGNFFNKLNLTLLQGYGQTEASPLISCNRKFSNDPRTVGPPVRNVKVKISSEGEILVKGMNLMQGYWKKSLMTKKTIINGWLHTGDLGEIDKQGRIIITGRKKELIITSGGDNISGQRIENILMSFSEISQVVVYGDNKPYLIALIKIREGNNEKDLRIILQAVNKNLNSIERIRKFIILDQELTYENGLMTQTMKIKRKKVLDFYHDQISKLYKSL